MKSKLINEVISGGASPSIQPNQSNDRREWEGSDYARNIRWIVGTSYNQPIVSTQMRGAIGDPYDRINTRFIDQYVFAARYIYGLQYNTEYEWASKDATNAATQIPMWRGLEISAMFRYFDGKCRQQFKPLPKILQANGISEGILSRKALKLNVLKSVVDAKKFLLDQKELGNIELEIPQGLNINDEMSIQKYFKSFMDEMEFAYRNIGKDFLYRNRYFDLFLKAAQYCFIGGRSLIRIYESKGRVYMRVVEPEYAIIDMTRNEDHHINDALAGEFKPYSVADIVARFDFTKEEVEDLEAIAMNTGNAQAPYVQGWNFINWYSNMTTVPKVWVADVEWRSITYIDGVPVECIRQGQLIGNKYLRNCGIKPNSVSDKRDKSRRRLDFCAFTPFTLLGSNMGVVMLVHKIQDMKDALTTTMQGMLARAMGKIPFVDTSQLPDFMKTPDMLAMMKQQGILVGNRTEVEAGQEKTNKMIEILDMTVDPNVQLYLGQLQYWDNVLADVLNMPIQSRLGSSNYVGEAQLQNNILSAETGTQWLYGGLTTFFQDVISLGVDKTRLVLADQDEEAFSLQIGDTAATLLKMDSVQEMLNDDFEIRFDFDSQLTEQVKATLGQITVQEAGVNPDAKREYIKIMRAETLDAVEQILDNMALLRQQAEQAAVKQQQDAAAANSAMQAQAQQNIAATGAATSMENKDAEIDQKLMQQLLEQEHQKEMAQQGEIKQ